jgi:hypothetical protein
MTIDPRLYEKVTGRRPGEALERAAGSMARRSSDRDTSTLGALAKGRWYVAVGTGLLVLCGAIYFIIVGV